MVLPVNEQSDPYRIAPAPPAVKDYVRLRKAGGMSPFSEEAAARGLKGTLFGVTVFAGDEAVGMGRIIGDNGCFFKITDIVVAPEHQGRGLGKRIMAALMAHLRANAPRTAQVSLLADVPANKLYEKFGFRETAPASLGMSLTIE